MSESRFTIRLCDEIATEQQLISYLHSLPKSRRAEHLRLLLTAGYASIISGSNPLPAHTSIPAASPVNQLPASDNKTTGSTAHKDVTSPSVLPVAVDPPPRMQAADQTLPSSSLDHREEEAPELNTSDESDQGDDMDDISPLDPLAKMKNKLKGKGA
ncbi:MAG: hypothetical protein G8D88_13835 [gamma proteobacterium symbiont of Ctena orbiculata]